MLASKKGPIEFAADEANRPDTTVKSLARLKSVFRPDGTISAGNALVVNVGAAAMIVCDRAAAREFGLEPVLAIRSATVAGEPGIFGLGPIPAIRKALERAGWHLDEVDRFEVSEVPAAVALVVQSELEVYPARLNVDGGAIARVHSIGATGAILITMAAHALRRLGQSTVVISLCIGGG